MQLLAYADSRDYSGAEAAFVRVVAALADSDDIDVVAAVSGDRLAEELAAAEVPVRRLPAIGVRGGLGAFDPRLIRAFRETVELHRPQVVLANLPSAQAGTVGLVSPVPALAWLHIPHSLAQAEFRYGWLRDRVAARRLRRARRIVVPAPSVMRWVSEAWGYPAAQTSWVAPPSGEPSAVHRDAARAQLGLPHDRRLLGVAGRLSIKQKGQDVAIAALAQPALRDSTAELVFAGGGADEAALLAEADAQGVRTRIHLLGHVADPSAFYGAIDLLLIPSRFEGLPLVAIEALKLGLPGIASAVDGLLDVWPEDWTVPAGDSGALARAARRLLDDDQGALAERARSHWLTLAPTYDSAAAQMRAELFTTLEIGG